MKTWEVFGTVHQKREISVEVEAENEREARKQALILYTQDKEAVNDSIADVVWLPHTVEFTEVEDISHLVVRKDV